MTPSKARNASREGKFSSPYASPLSSFFPHLLTIATKQKRLAVTEKQRKQIREYTQLNSHLTQRDVALWASREWGRTITQAMVCKTLDDRYAYLDTQSFPRGVISLAKIVPANYPILKKTLFEWVLSLNAKHVPLTGDMICSAASSFWAKMPDFRLLTEPKWSQGWLEGFKRRHKIKQYKQSGESASADIAGSEAEISRIQEVVHTYKSGDTYNCDETALFWLQTPDNTLASGPQSGGKNKKNKITVHVTSNATGTHKLDLWILGHFKNPRPFGKNRCKIQGLPFIWRHNKKA